MIPTEDQPHVAASTATAAMADRQHFLLAVTPGSLRAASHLAVPEFTGGAPFPFERPAV